MAIPTPESVYAHIKVTADTSEAFLAKLSADMADPDKVKNGFRSGGLFSFYVPGAMYGQAQTEVRRALVEAGWQVHKLDAIQGYMPSNEIIDFRAAGPGDTDVTGPSTFAWFHVQISKKPESN